jgi:hypothetical protein
MPESQRRVARRARANPSKHYRTPDAVLADHRLDAAEKRSVLESWAQEETELEAAEAENMAGGEPSRLAAVRRALDALDRNG